MPSSRNYSESFLISLFTKIIKRSVKFSGRTINEVIADTYINPKIETFKDFKNYIKNNKEKFQNKKVGLIFSGGNIDIDDLSSSVLQTGKIPNGSYMFDFKLLDSQNNIIVIYKFNYILK